MGSIKEMRGRGGGIYIEWGSLTMRDEMNKDERMNIEELER